MSKWMLRTWALFVFIPLFLGLILSIKERFLLNPLAIFSSILLWSLIALIYIRRHRKEVMTNLEWREANKGFIPEIDPNDPVEGLRKMEEWKKVDPRGYRLYFREAKEKNKVLKSEDPELYKSKVKETKEAIKEGLENAKEKEKEEQKQYEKDMEALKDTDPEAYSDYQLGKAQEGLSSLNPVHIIEGTKAKLKATVMENAPDYYEHPEKYRLTASEIGSFYRSGAGFSRKRRAEWEKKRWERINGVKAPDNVDFAGKKEEEYPKFMSLKFGKKTALFVKQEEGEKWRRVKDD